MMEQLDLFAAVPTEEWVYEILLPTLKNVLSQSNAGSDNLAVDKGKEYSSVSYLKQDPYDTSRPAKKQLAFRICCRNGLRYFGISNSFLSLVPAELMIFKTDSGKGDGFSNFKFESTREGVELYASPLSSVLDAVTFSLPKEFDCCSRFEQCSNAKRCIHSNPALATSCGYRKVLKSGRIFYGVNQTND